MKHFLVFCLAFAFACGQKSDVLELTESNFAAAVEKHNLLLVEFFAPWCGHCKKLAPEYERAATTLKENDPPISIAKVDCTAHQSVCSKYDVSGYPTLKIFRGPENVQDYNGGRTADAIVQTIQKQAGPAAKNLETVESYEAFLEKDMPVVIGFYEAGNSELKDFQAAAGTLRDDYKFAFTNSEEVMTKADAKNVMKFFRPKRLASKFEEQEMIIEGKPSGLQSFLKKNWLGKCYPCTPSNFDKFSRPLVVVLVNKLDFKMDKKGSNYYRNRVLKWGQQFEDKVFFTIGNLEEMKMMAPEDSTRGDKSPAIFIVGKDDRKYSMTEDFKMDTYQAFIQAYLNGELVPYIKSEPVPEPNDGPVTVVVGQNFDEIVMDDTKDVLIEFYAPWCGHCKSLAPKWDELGEKMADNNNVVIAKIDATANDSPKQFAVSGFPTIYWAPKDNKSSPQKYQGGREVNEFMKFLKDNMSPDSKSEL